MKRWSISKSAADRAFVALCYFVCYLYRACRLCGARDEHRLSLHRDDVSVGAASASCYFVSHAINLALERLERLLWIARIMGTWGLLSAAMALI